MALNVFFDIETLTTNRLATPREQEVIEYVVSYKYDYKNKTYEFTAPTLEEFIKRLKKLHVKHIILLAHNGEGYDFHFLRRSLVLDFGLDFLPFLSSFLFLLMELPTGIEPVTSALPRLHSTN